MPSKKSVAANVPKAVRKNAAWSKRSGCAGKQKIIVGGLAARSRAAVIPEAPRLMGAAAKP